MRSVLLVVALSVFASVSGVAQPRNGTCRGVVRDNRLKKPLPDVQVTLTNSKKEYKTLTNESGQYSLDLPPATYSLSAVLIGFARLNKPKIEIKESKTTQLDLQLVVGSFNSN